MYWISDTGLLQTKVSSQITIEQSCRILAVKAVIVFPGQISDFPANESPALSSILLHAMMPYKFARTGSDMA